MRHTFIKTSLLLCTLGAASLAHAQAPGAATGSAPSGEVSGRAERRHAIFDKLGLSADQKTQLKQIHERNKAAGQATREQMKTTKKQFAAALAGTASDDELRSLHNQLSQQREAVAAARFNGMLEVRKILTPEQRQKFGELYVQYRRESKGHRGHGGRGAELGEE